MMHRGPPACEPASCAVPPCPCPPQRVSVVYSVELSDLPLPLSFWHMLAAALPSLHELHARLSFRAPVVNNSLLPITAAFTRSASLKALVVTVLWRHFEDGPGDLLDLAPLRYTPSLQHFSMPNSCMDERDMAAMAMGTPRLQALVCSGMRFRCVRPRVWVSTCVCLRVCVCEGKVSRRIYPCMHACMHGSARLWTTRLPTYLSCTATATAIQSNCHS